MVSKRWQRTQSIVLHINLALGAALPFYLFETTLPSSQKILIIAIGYLVLIPCMRWLHRRFANTFIKVFQCEHDVAARIVQRSLNADRVPFTKRSGDEQVIFHIRQGDFHLSVDTFPLNLMVDSHLETKPATKLTLHPETAENAALMLKLRGNLDTAFAAQGW